MNSNPHDKYRGHKQWGWYLDDLAAWRELFARKEPVKVLEIGAFDGVSANLMLDLLFTHPLSEVHAIDPFLTDPTTPEVNEDTRACFEDNCRTGGHDSQVKLYEGLSAEVLAWMIAEEGFWENFDFIYVDGSHRAADVFSDAAMSWHLLKPGGVIAFDDYEWKDWRANITGTPRAAIDAFERCFADRIALLRGNWRRIFRRLAPAP